ncbi:MAG: VanZ family protein [Blautia sp.]|nr:VanZ family protein [Blautia sp.]
MLFWLVFILEVVLSHTPGNTSINQSAWLSSVTRVNEGLLRKVTHVVLFAILSFTVHLSWPETSLWARVGVVVAWSILDEVTKIPIPGRHCNLVDVVLNLVGTGIGCMIQILLL